MAEELLRQLSGGKRFEVTSAGIEPGQLNPFVVAVLKEEGIDITGKPTKAVSEVIRQNRPYDYVITVCDQTSSERCPVFPWNVQRLHWNFPDPSKFQGTDQEKLTQVRKVKEDIKEKIRQWIPTIKG